MQYLGFTVAFPLFYDTLFGTGRLQEEQNSESKQLASCLNVDDVHNMAADKLTPGAAAYYAAGAEDGNTIRENLQVHTRDVTRRPCPTRLDIDIVDISS